MLVLTIFIFGAASVCASDVNDTMIAGEDDVAIELSPADTDDVISAGENEEITSEGNAGTFSELQSNISATASGSTLLLTKDYQCEKDFDSNGIIINQSITVDGNGYTLDAQGISRIFNVTADNVILKNINFINGNTTMKGGAVFFEKSGTLSDCNFINNTATSDGGAVYFNSSSTVENCNFVNNTATGYGGAVYCYMSGNITNCNFTNNTATYSGGAIYSADQVTILNCNFNGTEANSGSALDLWQKEPAKISIISHSTFLNNKANVKYEAFESKMNGSNLEITFMGYDNLLNAIYSSDEKVNFTNVTYWGANGISNTDSFTPAISTGEVGQNITVKGVVNGNVIDTVMVTDADGKIVLEDVADYCLTLRHDEDSYYGEAEKTISNMTSNVNVTSQTTTNRTVNITAKSNIFNEVMPGSLLFILPDGNKINATYAANGTWWAEYTFEDCDVYQVNASYVGLDNVTVNNATITVEKINTSISVDDKIDTEVGKIVEINATLTPADAGNLTYVSSNESVIKLSGNLIVSVGEGTAKSQFPLQAMTGMPLQIKQ